MQQRYEADFRFNLVRARENSEQIALLKGEATEDARLQHRFSFVIENWRAIMSRTKRLTLLTASYGQLSTVFPLILVSPAYFAGKIQLGALMQTASAFTSVQQALSIFVDVYRDLAEWRAVVARLDGFDAAIAQAQASAVAEPAVKLLTRGEGKSIAIADLMVRLPNGQPLIAAEDIDIEPGGDSVLVTGPSGAGKSTFFRTVAGIWPFGSGAVAVPAGARVMVMPQQPYFPIATLAAAVSYPDAPGTFDSAQLAEAVTAAGLPQLVERLDQEAHWNRVLSQGEQQRLGMARALLQKPDFLFLDEFDRIARRSRRGNALQAAQDPARRYHAGVDRAPCRVGRLPRPPSGCRPRDRREPSARASDGGGREIAAGRPAGRPTTTVPARLRGAPGCAKAMRSSRAAARRPPPAR